MSIEIKDKFTNSVFQQLNNLVGESITIGTKNRIIKWLKVLGPNAEETSKIYQEAIKNNNGEVSKEPPFLITFENSEVKDKFESETNEIGENISKYDLEPIDYSKIENIESKFPYNFSDFPQVFENYK